MAGTNQVNKEIARNLENLEHNKKHIRNPLKIQPFPHCFKIYIFFVLLFYRSSFSKMEISNNKQVSICFHDDDDSFFFWVVMYCLSFIILLCYPGNNSKMCVDWDLLFRVSFLITIFCQ